MSTQFPLDFSLENGTHVVVTEAGAGRYDFALTPAEGSPRSFTYVEGERSKAEWDEITDFEQLDALRTFWLKTEDVV